MTRLLIVMIALSAFAGCVLAPPLYWGEEVHGRVVDAETNAPVEGAVVVANWILLAGGYGHGGHMNSLVVEQVLTDANGEFRFHKWGPKIRPAYQALDYAPALIIFKNGYEHRYLENETLSNAFVRRSEWSGKEIYLKRFKGDAAQRLDMLTIVLEISALQPLMLRELANEEPLYKFWPSGSKPFFWNVNDLLHKRGSNVGSSR